MAAESGAAAVVVLSKLDQYWAFYEDLLVKQQAGIDIHHTGEILKQFQQLVQDIIREKKKDVNVVELICSTVPKITKSSSRLRSDFSLRVCEVFASEDQTLLKRLWEETAIRVTQVWLVPDDHLFYYVMLCDLYVKDAEKQQYRSEDALCIGLERCFGKTRPQEAASRFYQVLKSPQTLWDKFEKAALSTFPLANKSKAIRTLCTLAVEKGTAPVQIVNAYVGAVFTSNGHIDENTKTTTWAFAPLLKSLSSEDVTTLLSGPVGRSLRLTTEKTLPAATLLCEALECSVIPEDCMLLPALKALRTSTKENVQDMASKLVSLALNRSSEATCSGVLKELCDEIPKEGSLYRRSRMIKALSVASPRVPVLHSKLVFATLLRRGKDEKTEDLRTSCFETAANWVDPYLLDVPVESDGEAVLSSTCCHSISGLRLLRVVLSVMKISAGAQSAIVKELNLVAGSTDADKFQSRLYANDILVHCGAASFLQKLDLGSVDKTNEQDCLAVARILAKFGPNQAGGPSKYYLNLGRLLSNSLSTVHLEARSVFLARVGSQSLEKEMMRAICTCSNIDDFVVSKFAIETMLPVVKETCDSEHFALALVLCFRTSLKDRRSTWASISKKHFGNDAKKGSFRFAGPLLLEQSDRSIDEDALCQSLLSDNHHLEALEPLLQRLKAEPILAVSSEESIAAYSAPPGRLSDYRLRLVNDLLQQNSDDEEDGDPKMRALRQGRRGRKTKEIYSAEAIEWERRIRAEQKEKNKQQQQSSSFKELTTHEMQALKAEEDLRAAVSAKVKPFENAANAVIAIARSVPVASQAIADRVLPLALELSKSALVGISARAILDAFLAVVFSRDSRLTPEIRAQIKKTDHADPSVLIELNLICQDSVQPLSKDLFEFVFPIILKFASKRESNENEFASSSSSSFGQISSSEQGTDTDAITDAMFNLLSVHHTLIHQDKREQLLSGLLHVVSKTPLPSSLDCVVSLFSVDKPTEREIDILVSDDGLLHNEPAVRLTALTALKSAENSPKLLTYLWYASSDAVPKNRLFAEVIASKTVLPRKFYEIMVGLLGNRKDHVRLQAAYAIAAGVDEHPDEAPRILAHLLNSYRSTLDKMRAEAVSDKPQIKFFERGATSMNKELEQDPQWYQRSGVAFTLSAFAGLEQDKIDASSSEKSLSAGSGGHNDDELQLPALGPVFEPDEALAAIEFVLSDGTRDPHPTVRAQMLSAGTSLLQAYGADLGETLIGLVQSYLEKKEDKKEVRLSEHEMDRQREGAVILLGAAASNLSMDDPRVPGIAAKLITPLETPSESVQRASVRILPQLMKSSRFKVENGGDGGKDLVELCVTKSLSPSSSFGSRKGHAMGLAALVKGLGIASLKTHSIVPRLTEASSSDRWETRQGCLFCFDELTDSLGRLFEPYVVQIVEPVLLKSFSDAQVDVRDAAHDACKKVMANLSAPGVSMLLPKLLSGISSPEWRTKQAAIFMLGSVAFCAPKQLASSLPQVVPRLIDSFTDTHPKVRAAAVAALKDVQSVVKNPEIEKITFVLISALTDPHEKTKDAVDVLFQTRFVHAVDAPSLSLLVPILRRGLKERSTETKKRSALIVGNMISMISDAKAVKPYLEDLLPVLKVVLVDPIPGVRGTAAKALGTLVRGLGAEGIPDFAILFQFLIDTMLQGFSSVERQGGAQGFVEVLVALQDDEALQTGLNKEVFDRLTSPASSPSVREGALWGLVFLPSAMENVQAYAGKTLDYSLNALADDSESVRDAAIRCSRVYVSQFTLSDPNIVLAALESGMMHLNWRVKQTAIRLLGDFVATLQKTYWSGGAYQGITAAPPPPPPMGDDEDGEDGDSASGEDDEDQSLGGDEDKDYTTAQSDGPADAVLLKLFGSERRDAVIATVYLLRSDGSSQVRQNALFVWKTIVSNTPRTMKRIIKSLMQNIVQHLSSNDQDRQKVGGKALADVVRKLGDRVLPEIIPVVLRGLDSSNESERIGVAMGLFELVGASSKSHLEPQSDKVLEAVLKGLMDENLRVSELAGKTFNRVHVLLGATADGLAPTYVLTRLCDRLAKDEERCTRGLMKAVESRSRDSLTFLLPRLLARPLQGPNVRALAGCMKVVPTHLHHYLRQIIRAFVQELAQSNLGPPHETESEIWLACTECFAEPVSDEQAVSTLLVELSDTMQNAQEPASRRAAMAIMASFLSKTSNLLEPDLGAAVALKSIIRQFAELDQSAISQAASAFSALVAHVGASNMGHHVDFIRNSIRTVASMDKHRPVANGEKREEYQLPAFVIPVCINGLLDVYQFALMNGTNEERESAAEGLGELVDLTSSDTLKPYVVKITGPLIRIVGDRFPGTVKTAILDTLRKLLGKGGVVLRPFLPQLQTTFVKALQNSTETVRSAGFKALQVLVPLSPRMDPLCNELVQGCTSADADIRQYMVKALLFVLCNRLQDVSIVAITKMLEKGSPIDACISDWQDATVRILAAAVEGKCLESILSTASSTTPEQQVLLDSQSQRLIERLEHCSTDKPGETQQRHGALLSLDAALRLSGGASFVSKYGIDPANALEIAARDEVFNVRAVACDATGWALLAKDKFPRSAAFSALLQQASKNDADSVVRNIAEMAMNRKVDMFHGALDRMETELA